MRCTPPPIFLSGLFNGREDFGNLALQSGKLRRKHRPAGMQYYIDVPRERGQIEPNGFAHAALDAIAIDGLTQNAPGRKADARTYARAGRSLREKVCHRGRKVFAASLIHALIIRVFS
jgi:hypothetical protein